MIIFTTTSFVILIAIDFYLEVQLVHSSPKVVYTQEKPDKKRKSRFKTGYLFIYSELPRLNILLLKTEISLKVSLCVVTGFLYLAYKDLEEYLEKQKNDNETNEIMISHIT